MVGIKYNNHHRSICKPKTGMLNPIVDEASFPPPISGRLTAVRTPATPISNVIGTKRIPIYGMKEYTKHAHAICDAPFLSALSNKDFEPAISNDCGDKAVR